MWRRRSQAQLFRFNVRWPVRLNLQLLSFLEIGCSSHCGKLGIPRPARILLSQVYPAKSGRQQKWGKRQRRGRSGRRLALRNSEEQERKKARHSSREPKGQRSFHWESGFAAMIMRKWRRKGRASRHPPFASRRDMCVRCLKEADVEFCAPVVRKKKRRPRASEDSAPSSSSIAKVRQGEATPPGGLLSLPFCLKIPTHSTSSH